MRPEAPGTTGFISNILFFLPIFYFTSRHLDKHPRRDRDQRTSQDQTTEQPGFLSGHTHLVPVSIVPFHCQIFPQDRTRRGGTWRQTEPVCHCCHLPKPLTWTQPLSKSGHGVSSTNTGRYIATHFKEFVSRLAFICRTLGCTFNASLGYHHHHHGIDRAHIEISHPCCCCCYRSMDPNIHHHMATWHFGTSVYYGGIPPDRE